MLLTACALIAKDSPCRSGSLLRLLLPCRGLVACWLFPRACAAPLVRSTPLPLASKALCDSCSEEILSAFIPVPQLWCGLVELGAVKLVVAWAEPGIISFKARGQFSGGSAGFEAGITVLPRQAQRLSPLRCPPGDMVTGGAAGGSDGHGSRRGSWPRCGALSGAAGSEGCFGGCQRAGAELVPLGITATQWAALGR